MPTDAAATAPLVLASTSPYRARLLARLGLPFERVDPAVSENLRETEAPAQRARRLALEKAQAVRRQHPRALVIGSDQVASLDGGILHKPGSAAAQRRQLQALSGRSACFDTAVALIGPAFRRLAVTRTRIDFRQLSTGEIAAYVSAEPAHGCCGGFRCEGLGITLFRRIRASDPTALEGLPLMLLSRQLRAAGLLPG